MLVFVLLQGIYLSKHMQADEQTNEQSNEHSKDTP